MDLFCGSATRIVGRVSGLVVGPTASMVFGLAAGLVANPQGGQAGEGL